jgi:hypothetical protein
MTLTPELGKAIVEKMPGAKPVLSTQGKSIGQHVQYLFRYEFVGPAVRQIAITKKATKEGVTVYVNQQSIKNSTFPNSLLGAVRLSKTYPKGFKGRTGDKGLSASAAQLSSLNPEKNDVLRLSVSTLEGFQELMSWYLDLNSANSAVPNESQEQGSTNTTTVHKSTVFLGSTIPKPEQDYLDADTKGLTTDEREAVVKVRYGQGSFRDALIAIAGEKCWMTGLEGKQLLIASHIKPWSHCASDTDSRGQPDNGLLLSALWDSAFDVGLITFDEKWTVISSSKLSESAKQILNIQKHFELPVRFRNVKRAEFLEYHRENIFHG